MYGFLKDLFGTTEDGQPEALTFEQLSEKLEQSDVKLANLTDGGYVSRKKYEAAIEQKDTEIEGIKTQLTNANNEIQSYRDMDIEGIKEAAKNWETKYNEDTQNLKDKLSAQERDHAEDNYLNKYKFTSVAARNGIKALFRDKKFALEDGRFLGADDYMKSLQEDDDYKGAFYVEEKKEETPDEIHAIQKPKFSESNPQGSGNPPKKLSLTEMMKLKNDNPNAVINFD